LATAVDTADSKSSCVGVADEHATKKINKINPHDFFMTLASISLNNVKPVNFAGLVLRQQVAKDTINRSNATSYVSCNVPLMATCKYLFAYFSSIIS
jgi:hypothetical protein